MPAIDESIEDVGTSTIHYLKLHPKYLLIPVAIGIVLEVVFIFMKATNPGVFFFPLFAPLIGYGMARSKIQHEFMQQFAAANGFSYTPNGSLAGLDGSLFLTG